MAGDRAMQEKDAKDMKLLIVGAGSFATEVDELARLTGYEEIGFLDDNPAIARCNPVVGCMDDIAKARKEYDTAIVALGNNEKRKQLHRELEKNGYKIPILIHPTAYISPDAVLTPGCIVRTKAVVSRYAKLGDGVIVNVGALIDHDCEIGEFSHILMGAVVRNSVKVAPGTWVKANEVVE